MPAPDRAPDPGRWLPLPPQDLQLLLAVVSQPLHGYAMMKAVEEQSGGALRVELGSLYRMIQRLERDGLIAQAEPFGSESTPGRDRRYYAITPLGRGVVAAELERLRRVLDVAASTPLQPDRVRS
jgi:DNA-binding PadR family transcriptional regulator